MFACSRYIRINAWCVPFIVTMYIACAVLRIKSQQEIVFGFLFIMPCFDKQHTSIHAYDYKSLYVQIYCIHFIYLEMLYTAVLLCVFLPEKLLGLTKMDMKIYRWLYMVSKMSIFSLSLRSSLLTVTKLHRCEPSDIIISTS